jgi:hypothetical protein
VQSPEKWSATTNCQPPTTNHRTPTTNHQPSTTNHQPPTTNHQPPALRWDLHHGVVHSDMHCLVLQLCIGGGGRIGIATGRQGLFFPAVVGEARHVIGDQNSLLVAVRGEITLLSLIVFHLQRRQRILELGCAAGEPGHDEPLVCKLHRGATLRRLTTSISEHYEKKKSKKIKNDRQQ